MGKFTIAILCLLTYKTDQFGLYDDADDVKIIADDPARKLRFFAEKVENHCFDGVPCSRKNFQNMIPVMVSRETRFF